MLQTQSLINGIDSYFENAWKSLPTYTSFKNENAGLFKESETEKTWFFLVPGVKKEDLSVYMEEGVLHIEADEEKNKLQKRIRYSLSLANYIGEEEITSKLEDGVLFVTIAKPVPEERRKLIDVK